MSARRRAKVIPLPTPCPWPPEAFAHLGGNLERIAGHLRGLVSALLDAVEHEQDRLQNLAPLAAYGAARAVAVGGEEA